MKKTISFLMILLMLVNSLLTGNLIMAEEGLGETEEVEVFHEEEESPDLVFEEDDVSETEETDEYRTFSEVIHYQSAETSDNEELLKGYIASRLYGELVEMDRRPVNLFQDYEVESRKETGRRLSGANGALYPYLMSAIEDIADGTNESTTISISSSVLGLTKTSWTAAELGYDSLNKENVSKVLEVIGFDFASLLNCLLFDNPYAFYWFDKTQGVDSLLPIRYNSSMVLVEGDFTFVFHPAEEYAGSVSDTVDTSLPERIEHSIDKAQSIVEEYAYVADIDKLYGYKREICGLTSYNESAANDYQTPYGNPWQLIWVFDEDPSTNVVCEGYSKAFQYLCDLTQFNDDEFCAYSVTGKMNVGTGEGNHMWNILHADDQKNYLVDVTNCDAGTIGYENGLFMVGISQSDQSSSVDSGYRITLRYGSILYVYDEDTRGVYTEDELTLASGTYQGKEKIELSSIILSDVSVSMEVGEEKELSVIFVPEDADDKRLLWSSSDEDIVSVSENGSLTALAEGTALITVQSVADPSVFATCEVEVAQSHIKGQYIHVDNTQISMDLFSGDHEYIVAYVYPYDATYSELEYSSDAEDIVSVDEYGCLTAHKEGTAVITVSCRNNVDDLDDVFVDVTVTKGNVYEVKVVCDENAYFDDISVREKIIYVEKGFALNEDPQPTIKDTSKYRFAGFYLDAEYKDRIDPIWQFVPQEDCTVYAKIIRFYSVVLDGNGGCFDDDPSKTVDTLTCDEGFVLEDTGRYPVKECYEFAGWSYEADGAVISPLSIKIDRDIRLYAKWTEKKTETPYVSSQTPSGSVLEKGSRIYLQCDTPNAKIYYTVDGTRPDPASSVYDGFIQIDEDVTIRAFAIADGYTASDIVFFSYTVKEEYEFGDITEEDRTERGIESPEQIPEGFWTSKLHSFTYDPLVKTYAYEEDDLRVYYRNKMLVYNKDYTVKYANNKKTGTATLTITGKGNYVGTLTDSFEILPLHLNEDDVMVLMNKDVFIFSNKTQKPTISAEYKGIRLKANTDYLLSYEDSNSKGAEDVEHEYGITLKFIGNYKGNSSSSYVILPKLQEEPTTPLSSVKVSALKNLTYTGEEFMPSVTLKFGKNDLHEDEDYELTYKDNKDAGTAYVTITGKGQYTGTLIKSFKILPAALTVKNVEIKGIGTSYPYTGSAWTPECELFYNGNKLIPNEDYTLTYKNNIKAGTATVSIKGIQNYKGTFNKTFKIEKVSFDGNDLSVLYDADEGSKIFHYEKGGVRPLPVVKLNGRELIYNVDYTLAYKNNTKLGTGTVTIKGKGSYVGTHNEDFRIVPKDLGEVEITAADKLCSAKANTYRSVPVLTDSNGKKLASGTDYDKNIIYTYADGSEVSKDDIIPAGTRIYATATGKGNYFGTATAVYQIVAKDISKASVKVADQYYTGRKIFLEQSDFTIKSGKDELGPDDFEILPYAYSNNIEKGTARVTIQGKGEYGGIKTVTFRIVQKSFGVTIVYNRNGAISGTMKDQMIYKPNTKLLNCAFKRSGYTFQGWSSDPFASEPEFKGGIYPYDIGKAGTTVILYAIWKRN